MFGAQSSTKLLLPAHFLRQVHARRKKMGADVDVSTLARQTSGFTGADLANLLNEAAILAARRRRQDISKVPDDVLDVLVGNDGGSSLPRLVLYQGRLFPLM